MLIEDILDTDPQGAGQELNMDAPINASVPHSPPLSWGTEEVAPLTAAQASPMNGGCMLQQLVSLPPTQPSLSMHSPLDLRYSLASPITSVHPPQNPQHHPCVLLVPLVWSSDDHNGLASKLQCTLSGSSCCCPGQPVHVLPTTFVKNPHLPPNFLLASTHRGLLS